jgi:hypothetical protein
MPPKFCALGFRLELCVKLKSPLENEWQARERRKATIGIMPKWRVFNVHCGQIVWLLHFWVHTTTFPSLLCQIVHKNLGRLVPVPTVFKNIFHTFLQSFFESHRVYDQTQVSGVVFSLLFRIYLTSKSIVLFGK